MFLLCVVEFIVYFIDQFSEKNNHHELNTDIKFYQFFRYFCSW